MSLFDSKFTKQTPIDSPTDGSMLSSSANQVFYVSMESGSYLCHCSLLFIPPYGSMGVFTLLCLFVFVCMVTDFSPAENGSGVKLCVLVRLLSGMSFSHFEGQWSKVKVTRDKKCA